ncbi:MAG: carboxypeptidase-like regulatory domain-containing protein [Bryobacteraceae bacterium]|jgi:hypothetical protein
MSLLRASIAFAVLLAAAQGQEVGSLAGTVVDPLRAVVPGAHLTLRGTAGEVAQTSSGKNGDFRFSNLAPGVYSVEAISPGLLTKTVAKIKVATGTERVVEIAMAVAAPPICDAGPRFSFDPIESNSAEIAGAVEVAGFRFAGNVLITAARRNNRGLVASTRTDKDGRFKLPIQGAGKYAVTAHEDGYADFIVEEVEVTKGHRTTINWNLALRLCPSRGRCRPEKYFVFDCM